MIFDISTRIDPKKAKSEQDSHYLLSLFLDIAEEMLNSGAETNRVEDSLFRILKSYGYEKVNVFCIPEFISVSFEDPNGELITQTRRVYTISNNMNHLEDLNALSRYIVKNQPGVTDIHDRLENMPPTSYSGNMLIMAPVYFFASGGFAFFFHGSLLDALVSGLIGIVIMLLAKFSMLQNVNKLLYTAVSALIACLIAMIISRLGYPGNIDKVMIGNVMLFIPGLALTTSFRDMLCGDIIAGLIRMMESLMIAAAIAVGYAIPIFFLGR